MLLATIYDPLLWVLTAGRGGALRRATLAAGCVGLGDAVLDVGCGTGSLVVAARETTGPDARLVGMDTSASMRDRARRRCDRAGARVELVDGQAQQLPFPDASFDVVVFSLVMQAHPMLHGGVAATAPDFGALLSAGGLAEVTRGRSPFAALQFARGTRRDH